jgi:diaminohydroxyphosphoribosylaminopyrimidine deaminase / 5-amino-6-(5-phosphoribosylamino)uracil reductase
MTDDRRYMTLALELATRARGRTWPNPMVGAVIVRDGEVIGQGWHKRAGLPHAEIEAISAAGERARGATLYVTLEPCCHTNKRTPPCVEAISRAGIRRVFYAMPDPNRQVCGQGHAGLEKSGVEAAGGLMQEEARKMNEVYHKYMTTGLPFCTLKLALSLDGRIALGNGVSRGLSGEESLKMVHQLRLEHEAILVGAGTVRTDDPRLTVRLAENPDNKQPTRFILDGALTIPLTANVCDQSQAKTVIVTGENADEEKQAKLEKREIEVWQVKSDGRGMIEPRDLLHKMGLHEYVNVLVEGGSRVAASFLKAGLVDKVMLFYSPRLIGGDGIPASGPLGINDLARTINLKDVKTQMVGRDVLVEGYPLKQGSAN